MCAFTSILPTHLNTRKAQGRALLDANRVDEALTTYARILRDYPDEIDAYLFLGDWYLGDGDGSTALIFYQEAARRDPGEAAIQQRLRLAGLELGIARRTVAASTYEQLVQRLAGEDQGVPDRQVAQAEALLSDILDSPQPRRAVAERLEEIEALLPALVELNIRQAQADGRTDLAQTLAGLLARLPTPPAVMGHEPAGPAPYLQQVNAETTLLHFRPRILWVDPGMETLDPGGSLPALALATAGCTVSLQAGFPANFQAEFDLVIVHNPHADPALLGKLAACSAAQMPFIVDLDGDFEQMPLADPRYPHLGLKTAERARAYTGALALASRVVVPSAALAAALQGKGHPALSIEPGWNPQNPLWTQAPPSRSTVNLGWLGTAGQVEDVAEVRRILNRVLREFPHTRLVVSGEPRVYQLFDTLPEARIQYLPAAGPEDRPFLLGQVDILLAPLRPTPFNQNQSSLPLLEAGLRGIPWVASPVPAFEAWGEGGFISPDLEAWHTNLRQLILDPGLCRSLGNAGRRKAYARSLQQLGQEWLALAQSLFCAG